MTTDISQVPIELWSIEDIEPYPFNNKKHPEKHIELLARSIKTQGHLEPLVLDAKGVIISGHGRFLALKRLGRLKVAVRVLRDISESEAMALRISANKTVSNEYDTDMLSQELNRLSEMEFDISVLGFDDKELSMLITDVGLIDEDTLVIDMDTAVEAHEADIDAKSDELDDEQVRLDKAFGFKTIPLRGQRIISRFLAEAEALSGRKEADLLVWVLQNWLDEHTARVA
jgi:ParB-like chromosome segregation protein Spo0J